MAALAVLGCAGKVATEPPFDVATDVATDSGHETTGDAGCDFVYRDLIIDGGVGDGLCYKACATAADCPDPARPNCSVLGLWKGGDWACNGRVRICMAERRNDCPFP